MQEIVAEVRAEVSLPLAVKLSPFFTNSARWPSGWRAGADGLVLFNRFYQPDIDIEALEVRPNLLLSTPHDLRLPLRWIALLHGREPLDLAASGGVHRGTDAVRLLMAGACVTQVVGALLRHGPRRLSGWRRSCASGWRSTSMLSARADRLHEPEPLPRSQRIRAGSLHAGGPDLPPGRGRCGTGALVSTTVPAADGRYARCRRLRWSAWPRSWRPPRPGPGP